MRRIVLSLLPLLVAAPLAGQATVGVRAGLNRSTVSAEDASGQDARMGMVIGVDAALPLAGAIDLRVGGAYSQKGFGFSDHLFGSFGFEMDYVQVSALVRMGTSRDEGLSVGVLVGPWAAFRVSCNVSVDVELGELFPQNESASCNALAAEEGTDDPIKETDFGIVGGAGVELIVSEGLRLGLDALYAMGLANINDESGSASDSIKNRSLAIQVGVVVPFGG